MPAMPPPMTRMSATSIMRLLPRHGHDLHAGRHLEEVRRLRPALEVASLHLEATLGGGALTSPADAVVGGPGPHDLSLAAFAAPLAGGKVRVEGVHEL